MTGFARPWPTIGHRLESVETIPKKTAKLPALPKEIRPAHILIVDDEPQIAESLADFLGRQGHLTSIAYSGREAFDFLQDALYEQGEPVDLVLLDMRMPEMPGFEVLKQLRDHQDPDLKFTRVIMLTAATGHQEKIDALNAGADDYITKPYQPQELLARVRTLLRTQQLEKLLQHQRQQLAHLNRIGQEMAMSHDVRGIMRLAVREARKFLDCEVVGLFVPNKAKQRILCQHLSGAAVGADHYPAIPMDQGIIGQTARKPAVYRLGEADLALDKNFVRETDVPPKITPRSLMSVPVIAVGHTWAVLVAYNKRQGNFSEFDLDLIASLSTFLGGAAENAYLVQNLRARQQELLDNRNSLQAIIDGILHPIYTIDDRWQLVAVNENKGQELEREPAAMIGQPCYRAFFGRTTPCDHCHAAETLTGGTSQTWSVQWLGEDRLPREWDVNSYPIPGQRSGSASAVVVWQDRTEERRLERSLLQAGKLAAIGQLAAGVAHEINNPLTAINANAEMMRMVIPKDDDQFEAVDLILRAGQRAAKVVRGLLDFARERQYTFIPLNITDTIEQALELVAYQLHAANVTIKKDLPAELPWVMASSEHVKSVWINLMINARDAMRDAETEEPILEIIARLAQPFPNTGQQVEILVRDNGPGIPPAEAAHIFEPFYTTKDPGKGTGLGLATCHRIIEQHGGLIEMISTPGRGATFVVRLPAVEKKTHRRRSA